MSRPPVVDTFMVNDEFDILQMRLETMSPAVDWFVAVEADVDHQNHPKPYRLSENLDRFDFWADKLIVVQASGSGVRRGAPVGCLCGAGNNMRGDPA